jgi:hypothetical protein
MVLSLILHLLLREALLLLWYHSRSSIHSETDIKTAHGNQCDNGPEHWPSLRRKPHVGCRLDLDLLVLVHRVWILPRSDVAVPPRDISEDRGQRFDPTDEAFGTTSAHYAPLEC